MTREEAIRFLTQYVDNECYTHRCQEANRMAISALREQEEREKGCEYCTDSKSVYHRSSGIHDSMDEDVYISGNSLVVDIGCHSYGSVDIKICPMCGRRLPQPQKGE